jgi:hypothetical protein
MIQLGLFLALSLLGGRRRGEMKPSQYFEQNDRGADISFLKNWDSSHNVGKGS